MPYIPIHRREPLNDVISAMIKAEIKADGDLNYILFAYCKNHVTQSYSSLKSFIGELEECAAEIRRRILSPYEDEKIKENGDV